MPTLHYLILLKYLQGFGCLSMKDYLLPLIPYHVPCLRKYLKYEPNPQYPYWWNLRNRVPAFAIYICVLKTIITKPGVAGAVVQTP